MLIYDNESEAKENKNWTKDKMNYSKGIRRRTQNVMLNRSVQREDYGLRTTDFRLGIKRWLDTKRGLAEKLMNLLQLQMNTE